MSHLCGIHTVHQSYNKNGIYFWTSITQSKDFCVLEIYLPNQSFKKCKNKRAIPKNAKKSCRRNANFPHRSWEFSTWGSSVSWEQGLGAGGKGRVVQAGRMLATGHERGRQDPSALVTHSWLTKKSLEEGAKSINSLVLMSQKVRWPQNDSEGEVWICHCLNELFFSDFHFLINYKNFPRTVASLFRDPLPHTHLPDMCAHTHHSVSPAGL